MTNSRAPSEREFDNILPIKLDFVFNPTEKVIDNIIIELDEINLFTRIQYGQKIGTIYSKLVLNCQILIDLTIDLIGSDFLVQKSV